MYHVKEKKNVDSGWSDQQHNNVLIIGGDNISSGEPDSHSGLGHSCLRATKFYYYK
jgi:hypothetical protein